MIKRYFFMIEDDFYTSPSLASLSLDELGLWVCMVAYANRKMTDGMVPMAILEGICRDPSKSQALASGLLAKNVITRDGDALWVVGFLDHNPSRSTRLAMVKARKMAGAAGGKARKYSKLGEPSKSQALASGLLTQMRKQNPTRERERERERDQRSPLGSPPPAEPAGALASPAAPPMPKVVKGATSSGSRLPADWEPSAATVATLAKSDADPLRCLPAFRDHWAAQPGARGRKADWDATFRNWVRRDAEFKRPAQSGTFRRLPHAQSAEDAIRRQDPWLVETEAHLEREREDMRRRAREVAQCGAQDGPTIDFQNENAQSGVHENGAVLDVSSGQETATQLMRTAKVAS